MATIKLTVDQIIAIEDNLFVYYKELIIPKESKPFLAPTYMEPWIIDDEQEIHDNGAPCWSGYHPEYPTRWKWFANDFGGRGTVLKVRFQKLYVEIMDIVAEENSHGAWQWSIKLVKHYREVK